MLLRVGRLSLAFLVVLAALLVSVVGTAKPALAHFAGGPQPSNYVGEITSISPAVPGVSIKVIDNGDRMEVTNTTDTPVIVYGYDHRDGTDRDQYLKIAKNGVWVNTNSGAYYLNRTLYGTSSPPTDPTPDAEPVWKLESSDNTYRWHDHRTHWMSAVDPPQVAADPTESHVIIPDWKLTLAYGASTVVVTGDLVWEPPSTWQWWAVIGLALLLGLAVGVVRQWRPLAVGALGVLVLADVVHLVTSPFPEDATQGSRTFAMVAAAVPTLAIIGLALLAVRSLRRGSGAAHFPMAAAGWLAAIQGLSDISVVWNSQLPQSGPGWLARAAVCLVIGLGIGLGIAAFLIGHREAPRYGVDSADSSDSVGSSGDPLEAADVSAGSDGRVGTKQLE